MRHIDEYETTDNPSVWKKLHKYFHAACSYCRWHKGENAPPEKEYGVKKKRKVKKVSLKEVVK